MPNPLQPVGLEERKEPPKAELTEKPQALQPAPPQPEQTVPVAGVSGVTVPQAETGIRSFSGKEFIAYLDAQIEQAHDALSIFEKKEVEVPVPQSQEPPEPSGQREESRGFWESNKIYILLAGALVVLGIAATLWNRFFGGEGRDWRSGGGEAPSKPSPASGGSVQEPEPEPDQNFGHQDITSLALGIGGKGYGR